MGLDWKKLLLGIFIGVGMAMMPACSNDEGYDTDGNGQEKETAEPTEMGYLSMRLSLGSVAAKANPGTDFGRVEEQAVKNVWLVLYGPDNTVKYRIELEAANTNGTFVGDDVSTESTATSSRFVTVGQPVVKQAYKMLVLVNPIDAYSSTFSVGQPISELETACNIVNSNYDPLTATDGWAENNHFFMSNSQGLVNVDESDIKKSAKDAERSPKLVSVDRGVAKIVVDATVPALPNGDKFGGLRWDLDVINQYSYWIRHLGYLSGGVTPEYIGDGSSRYERYAVDPNFSNISEANGGSPVNQFYYLPSGGRAYEHLRKNFGSAYANYNYVYALENTMDANDQYQDVTTRVVIGGYYRPYVSAQGEDRTVDFFTFGGIIIREEDMQDYANYPSTIPGNLKSLGLGEAIDAVKQVYGSLIFSANLIKDSFSIAGLNYYSSGMCYYTVLIRHFGEDLVPQKMGYGRYGIVRNNVYKLTITNITGPGSPILEKPGPEPDDGTPSISANIQVLPWQIREQVVEDLQ